MRDAISTNTRLVPSSLEMNPLITPTADLSLTADLHIADDLAFGVEAGTVLEGHEERVVGE